jgi:hypothetical protein
MGAESVCEAAFLGKAVLMAPLEQHHEQRLNALDAEIAGLAVGHPTFDLRRDRATARTHRQRLVPGVVSRGRRQVARGGGAGRERGRAAWWTASCFFIQEMMDVPGSKARFRRGGMIMRNTWSVAVAVILAAAPIGSSAQVGVKAGASFGHVSNAGLLPGDVGRRGGFTLGVSAVTPGLLGLGVEAFYSQRGVSSQAGANSREIEYLDFLALVRAKVPTPGIAPYAFAGPQISYELACNAGDAPCPGGDRTHWPTAGVIGAGVAFGGDTSISVEARYIYGLQDLQLETVTSQESYHERSFVVLAGIAF